ncbi:MAG TPA: retropepsin-like aspartic protease [Anaerolineae bacterium]|nr:retropepsin-like aspartic protease [Anaerolineae bacterium]
MTTPYSQDYVPPAPVLLVSLTAPAETSQVGPYPALIDTGADGTFVPTALLERLSVPIVYATNVRSHLATRLRRVSVHKVDVLFDGVRLPDVEVVSDDSGDEIIIGRNVLNKLQLFLDGPKRVTDLR